jgi:hypothetical protein
LTLNVNLGFSLRIRTGVRTYKSPAIADCQLSAIRFFKI